MPASRSLGVDQSVDTRMPTSNSLTRDESGFRRVGSLADCFPSNVCSCPHLLQYQPSEPL